MAARRHRHRHNRRVAWPDQASWATPRAAGGVQRPAGEAFAFNARTVLRWSLPPSIVIIAAGPSGRSHPPARAIIALGSTRRGAARCVPFTILLSWLLQQSACCSVHSVSAAARVDPSQLN